MGNLLMVTPYDWDGGTITASDNPAATPVANLLKTDPSLLWNSGSNQSPHLMIDAGIARPLNIVAPLFSRASKYATWRITADSNSADLPNSALWDSERTWGRAISLDAGQMTTNSNTYILPSFSIAFRVMFRKLDAFTIFRKVGISSTTAELSMVRSGSSYQLRFKNRTANLDPAAETNLEWILNRWYYVVATYDSVTLSQQIWVDGVLAGAATALAHSTSGYNLEFGGPTSAGTRFDGWIQEISLWDHAISSTQITSMLAGHMESYPSPPSGLVSYWIPNEDSGITIAPETGVSGFGSDPRNITLSGTYHWSYGMPLWASGGLDNYDRKHGMYFFPGIFDVSGIRYCRLDFRDPGKSNLELGRLILGAAYQPTRNYKYNATYGHRDYSDVYRAPSGSVSIRRGAIVPFVKYSIQFTKERELRANVIEMQRRIGGSREILVCLDPDDDGYRIQRMYYGLMGQVSQAVHQQFGLFEAGFEVEGIV